MKGVRRKIRVVVVGKQKRGWYLVMELARDGAVLDGPPRGIAAPTVFLTF